MTSLTAGAASLFSRSFDSFGCEKGQSGPENVARRVFVGLGGVTALGAHEFMLAVTAPFGCVPRRFAALGREPGIYVNDSPPSFFRFRFEDVDEGAGRPAEGLIHLVAKAVSLGAF